MYLIIETIKATTAERGRTNVIAFTDIDALGTHILNNSMKDCKVFEAKELRADIALTEVRVDVDDLYHKDIKSALATR